ncbi:LEAF RUST 10 DISEASE-RESISTANCE LOCUS RECEPTOR-LIKE PROTEIN KINASE-like 2.7 [Gossypium raimondii]|uniref:LEAF RUST 10 DISEASE-RESISTANCE LOCUS RECEPTOR-LIKE PROTEIN KINASE-like 2.7 n=1 Tax=Gossypium raimondii TaxID=29730 RepID=UPI00227A3AB8|nr:LEAF RUST 10 DISEASE-RESISTANCE LOCUS RECEPTOR-LIKE PROTEIN KINASE-like 2.7 [Gossypium raimondii]
MLQLGAGSGVSRLRSSSLKKPPEPLHRAVADCLSSSSFAAVVGGVSSHHQGGPLVLTEASRTLRCYPRDETDERNHSIFHKNFSLGVQFKDCSATIYINTIVAKKEVVNEENSVFEEFEKTRNPGLALHCDVFTNTTKIEIVGVKYEVLDIHHENQILRIAREDFIKNGSCHPQIPIQDSILNSEPFVLGSGNTNLTLSYDCQSSSSFGIFPCNSSNYNNVSITTDNIRPDGCSANVRVPILQSSWERLRNDSLDLEEALETGFEVQWKEDTEACRKCNASGGACGFDKSNNQTFCYCPSGFESSPDSNECHRALLPPSPTNTGSNNTRGGSKSKLKLTPIIIGMKSCI